MLGATHPDLKLATEGQDCPLPKGPGHPLERDGALMDATAEDGKETTEAEQVEEGEYHTPEDNMEVETEVNQPEGGETNMRRDRGESQEKERGAWEKPSTHHHLGLPTLE